jgi:hypothetical protein
MPMNLEDSIAEELLSLEATVELTLQCIQKLRKKLNTKPKRNNKPLSDEHVANILAARNKIRLKKTI